MKQKLIQYRPMVLIAYHRAKHATMKTTHKPAFAARCETSVSGQNLLAIALIFVIAFITTADNAGRGYQAQRRVHSGR